VLGLLSSSYLQVAVFLMTYFPSDPGRRQGLALLGLPEVIARASTRGPFSSRTFFSAMAVTVFRLDPGPGAGRRPPHVSLSVAWTWFSLDLSAGEQPTLNRPSIGFDD